MPGLAPVRAFFVVCAIATIVGGGLFATRDASPSEPPRTPAGSPDYTLTDEEAIAEFERLNAQLMQAYEERNIALAEDVFTSDSPMLPRVRKELRTLVDRSVVSLSRFEEISTEIRDSGPEEVILHRVEILHPRFQTEEGRNASSSTSERLRVRWVLRVENGRWLLHDAVVLQRQILKEDRT